MTKLYTVPLPLQSNQSFSERQCGIRPAVKTWQARGIAASRVTFGLMWAVAAWLKWQPEFLNKFLDQVTGAQDGQPQVIREWIGIWASIIRTNPLMFARVEALIETVLAVFLIFGVLSNLTYVVGMLLSLGIWSTAEGFGGPYIPGQSTDVGTGFAYALLFVVFFLISAGCYYGLDQWLTPRLGRFGFLASGTFRRRGGRKIGYAREREASQVK